MVPIIFGARCAWAIQIGALWARDSGTRGGGLGTIKNWCLPLKNDKKIDRKFGSCPWKKNNTSTHKNKLFLNIQGAEEFVEEKALELRIGELSQVGTEISGEHLHLNISRFEISSTLTPTSTKKDKKWWDFVQFSTIQINIWR